MGKCSYSCTKCGDHSRECIVKLGGQYYRGTYDNRGGVDIAVDNSKNHADAVANHIKCYPIQFADKLTQNDNEYAAIEIFCDGVTEGGNSTPKPSGTTFGTTRRGSNKRKGGGQASSSKKSSMLLSTEDIFAPTTKPTKSSKSTTSTKKENMDPANISTTSSSSAPRRHCAPKGAKIYDSISYTLIKVSTNPRIPTLKAFRQASKANGGSTSSSTNNGAGKNRNSKKAAAAAGVGSHGNNKKNKSKHSQR